MKTTLSKFTAGLLLMSFSFAIIGCGTDAPALDTNLQKQHSDKLISLRSYFDKAKGDYSALNEADKAEFLKLCDGDQEKANITWDLMKNGRGGDATTGPQ